MERLDALVKSKRALAQRYAAAFKGMEGVHVVAEPAGACSNFWLNTLVLDGEVRGLRDDVLRELHARQILARPLWTPLHQLPMYVACPRAPLRVAEDMYARCISLPSSAFLQQKIS
jgi:perosamine synthetase